MRICKRVLLAGEECVDRGKPRATGLIKMLSSGLSLPSLSERQALLLLRLQQGCPLRSTGISYLCVYMWIYMHITGI